MVDPRDSLRFLFDCFDKSARQDFRGFLAVNAGVKRWQWPAAGAIGAIVLAIAGCADVPSCKDTCRYQPDRGSGPPWQPPEVTVRTSTIETHTAAELVESRYIERVPDGDLTAKNRGSIDGTRPRQCMAFSGGGVRSGSFAIGILSALHEQQILGEVDAIASVSGGGYAASWYYTQLYREALRRQQRSDVSVGTPRPLAPPERNEIEGSMFELPDATTGRGRYQEHLRTHARLMTESQVLGMGLLTVAWSVPANLVANGFVSTRSNVGVARWAHERSIRLAFQTAPRRGPVSEPDNDVSLHELGRFAIESKLPQWFIAATHWPGGDSPIGQPLSQSVFTFGPSDYGADSVGRWQYAEAKAKAATVPRITVGEAVARSAAAVDSNTWTRNAFLGMLASGVGIDLGGYLPNPAISAKTRQVHASIPLAYFGYRHKPDIFGTHLYLSDGGHAENLGVFALLQAGCQRMLVVDAEHDPRFQFEGYFQLMRHLMKDNKRAQIELWVEGILRPSDSEWKRRLAKATPDQINEMARDGTLVGFLESGVRRPKADSDTRRREYETRPEQYAAAPVMKGSVTTADGERVDLVYAKLAYAPNPDDGERREGDTYYLGLVAEASGEGCANPGKLHPIAAYYQCQLEKCTKGRTHSPLGDCGNFPQQPTRDQNFSPTQFSAYVALGRRIGLQAGRLLKAPP